MRSSSRRRRSSISCQSPSGHSPPRAHRLDAGRGGDGEAVGHRHADPRHLGDVGALAAEQRASSRPALGQVVDVPGHGACTFSAGSVAESVRGDRGRPLLSRHHQHIAASPHTRPGAAGRGYGKRSGMCSTACGEPSSAEPNHDTRYAVSPGAAIGARHGHVEGAARPVAARRGDDRRVALRQDVGGRGEAQQARGLEGVRGAGRPAAGSGPCRPAAATARPRAA